MLFTGFSAFPLTPTSDDGELDSHGLKRVLDPVLAAQVDSVGLLGSTGAYPYLSLRVRKEVLNVALDHIAGRVPVVVGVGALRTAWSVELATDAANAGADGLLLAPISYQRLSEEEVFQHFKTIAEATPLPLCIYNNPGTTQFQFSADLIARLAEIPTIRAIKMPLPVDGDFASELAQLRAMTPDDFQIGYSGDWGCAAALLAGAACWHSAVGGILPAQCKALAEAALQGDAEQAKHLSNAFEPLWDLTKTHGSYRISFAIAHIMGVTQALPLSPILPLPNEVSLQVENALAHLNSAFPEMG